MSMNELENLPVGALIFIRFVLGCSHERSCGQGEESLSSETHLDVRKALIVLEGDFRRVVMLFVWIDMSSWEICDYLYTDRPLPRLPSCGS